MNTETQMLETGTHFGSSWGIYQTPLTVQLALNLGWEPDDRTDLERIVQQANTHMGMSTISEEECETLDWAFEEALEWINDNRVPEGYWFGHHSDIGDMGVWNNHSSCLPNWCEEASEPNSRCPENEL